MADIDPRSRLRTGLVPKRPTTPVSIAPVVPAAPITAIQPLARKPSIKGSKSKLTQSNETFIQKWNKYSRLKKLFIILLIVTGCILITTVIVIPYLATHNWDRSSSSSPSLVPPPPDNSNNFVLQGTFVGNTCTNTSYINWSLQNGTQLLHGTLSIQPGSNNSTAIVSLPLGCTDDTGSTAQSIAVDLMNSTQIYRVVIRCPS
jgi:hypothetical protein